MRYVIHGAGAIGGAIGASLHQVGFEVVLIARGPHLEALRSRGLTLATPAGTATLPIPAAGHPGELRLDEERDVVVLAVKSQETEAALAELAGAAGPGLRVLCAQNGVENERSVLRRFERTYGVMVWVPASHLEPGIVTVHSSSPTGILDVGRVPEGADAFAESLAADFERAGFSARALRDVMRWKYAKLLSNLGNAVEAACGHDGDPSALLEELAAEGRACLRAAGIAFASEEEMRDRIRGLVRIERVGGEPRQGGSSWQSLARGTGRIESDFLNGEVALLGRRHGIPTPRNAALQALARRLAQVRQRAGSLSLDELRARLAAATVPCDP